MSDLVNSSIEIVKFAFKGSLNRSVWLPFALAIIGYAILNIGTAQQNPVLVLFVIVAFSAVNVAVQYMVMRAGLELKGLKLRKNSIGTFLGFVVLNISAFLAAVFSAFDVKFITLLAVGLALVILGGFGVNTSELITSANLPGLAVMALGLFVLAVYSVVVFRSFIRLYPAQGRFFEGAGIIESLILAWEATPGKALKIFLVALPISLLAGLFSYFGSMLSTTFTMFGALFGSAESISTIVGGVFAAFFYSVSLVLSTVAYAAVYQWIDGKKAIAATVRVAAVEKPAAKPLPTAKSRLIAKRNRKN